MTCWQIDFKDVSSVPADPDGKRQHVVETLNIIDTGTSILLDAHVRSDFTAETALEALALTLAKYGRGDAITLDRDPRWVGSPAGSDFPAALLRFGSCLGMKTRGLCSSSPGAERLRRKVQPNLSRGVLGIGPAWKLARGRFGHRGVCPTLQPRAASSGDRVWESPTVDSLPADGTFTRTPGDSRPGRLAASALDGLHLERKVDRNGTVSIDLKRYYVSSKLVGQRVVLSLDADEHCMHVLREQQSIKDLPLRGLVGRSLSYEQFLAHMLHQAKAQARLRSLQERKYRTAAQASP
jgi:hypothetical protein